MRNYRKLLPVTLLSLITAALMVTLLLAHFLSPGPTHAVNSNHDESQSVDPQAIGQTDEESLANCRYGVTTNTGTSFIISQIGAGIFYRWEPDWPGPLPENGAELMHMIRPRQRKTSSGEYLPEWYSKVRLDSNLAAIIRSDPGAVWMIGNESERGPNPGETWSARTDDMFADIYVEAYHEIYHFIKGIDPTARIANAGLIQITPMRLQYLDLMWDAYEQKFGAPMPVDVWTIHTYVLPELTPEGEANGIASVANGTDPALGKRQSGRDLSKCPDPDVYCYAEHDDPALLEEQVISMRQWMKDHGQQNKPLVITEYGTLYHYKVKEDGSCGLRDENGDCFTPERVSQFMLDTFDYFNNARDPNTGMPTDDDKLVQQWIWYGAWNWDISSADLLQNDYKTLTLMGETFRDHVFAEPTYVNLVVDGVTGAVIAQDEDNTATAQLAVSFRNNGNIAIEKPFTVTFYKDAALTQPIDSVTITPNISGCATRAYSVEVEMEGLAVGNHQFWVYIDSNNVINESDTTDNIGSGQLAVAGTVYTLDVQIINDGDGVGGTVNTTPSKPTYLEGSVVSLVAVPFSGWDFTGWKGAIIGNVPRATVNMNDDVTIEAHFLQDRYALTVGVTGDGEVIVSPSQDYYVYGDQVSLLAVPAPGWRFDEWSGEVPGDTPLLRHSVDGDAAFRAVFEVSYDIMYPLVSRGY